MTIIQVCSGKCLCGKKLEMRISNSNEGEKDQTKKILFWMIHGFCTKCMTVYLQGLFKQEEQPVEDRDYMIEWNKKVMVTGGGKVYSAIDYMDS